MAETRRLFFALELPTEVQQQIIQWRATQFPEDSGRPVAADKSASDSRLFGRYQR